VKQSALHRAACQNRHACLRLLIDRGADVDVRDFPDNAYPLHVAAAVGDLETVRILVEAGADVIGEADDYEVGVLGWATCFRTVREDVAAYLLEHGARLNLWTAIALDRVDAVRGMVARDATLLGARMTRNQHRRTALHHAAAKNRPRIVRLLIDLGADLNATDATGATPLTTTSQEGADPAIVEMLVAAGARLDFLTAVNLKRYDLAEAMLAEDPTRLGADGRDTVALHLAVNKKNHDAVRWLIAHGVDVDAKRMMWDCNHTALHMTIENGDITLARMLLDAGADPDIRDDKYGATALGWADFFGRDDFAKLVRERGGHK
jgi:ankyrin repeat protein